MTVLYYTLKCCDLIETFIFVLRKKSNQVSMLHVYHHLMVIIGTYIELMFSPSGHNMLPGLMNAMVHAVMYSYYFMSAYDPNLMKLETFKRWKKIVTQIQLVSITLFVAVINDFLYQLFFSLFNIKGSVWLSNGSLYMASSFRTL